MNLVTRLACIASLAVAGVAGAAPQEAGEAPATAWDQAKVTALAGELSAAVKGIRTAVRQTGSPSIGSMQSRHFHQFKDKLRLIESESRHLASELAEGQGLEPTLPAYRHLRLLVRDARELARSLFIGKQTQDRIDVGRAKLDALAAYYPPEK
ncbi:MAG: hypothetical protein JRH10_20055 [Deltaproteobacteria bacterium]|nr:hypothetical protein [Deltaproteobacteria bacterium]MBW2446726.1 hypothetical protein [Deltaproteobacteria bacterium]